MIRRFRLGRSPSAWIALAAMAGFASLIGCGGGGAGGGSTGATNGATTGSTSSTTGTTSSTTGTTSGGSTPSYFYFCSDRGGFPELWRLANDGTGLQLVSTDGWAAEIPASSSDGQAIAFSSTSVFTSLFSIRADGSNFATVASTDDDNTEPSVSPNGATVLFTSNRTGIPQLFTAPIGGGSATQITDLANGAVQGRWSPDGTRIVFVSGFDNDDVYLMDANGTNIQQLTSNLADESQPGFSPDGAWIVYVRDFGTMGDFNGQIMRMTSTGSNQTRLTTSLLYDDEPCYSANGQFIFFTREAGFAREIFRMSPDGTGEALLTNDGAFAAHPRAPGL